MPAINNFLIWNSSGILPPVKPERLGNSNERSPYQITLSDFVERFALSQKRIKILEGFLAFRSELHKLEITQGFQWLNGSFLEDIEFLENRSPRDLDVVTFYKLPTDETQETLIQKNEKIFNTTYLKSTFAVDGYFVMLGYPVDAGEIETITYWYSMWSHRRDGLWKGFVKIDLDPSQDTKAKEIIKKTIKEVSNDKSL